jgi:predicted deacylase
VSNLRTGFERSGSTSWTSQSDEQTFLRDLDAASDHATVTEIGRTVQNRPIQLITLGAPKTREEIAAGPSVLFTCTQHGNEPAGREACLMAARDYAASGEAATVLIIPTANPDGVALNQRPNANGVDVNRDHLKLSTPEARAMAAVIRDYKPDVLGDMHEYQTSGASQVLFSNPTMPHKDTDAQVAALANTLNASYVAPAVRAAGFSTGIYGQSGTDESIMRQMSGLRHVASLLVETPRLGTLSHAQRVRAQRTAITSVLKMFHEKAGELASTTSGAAQRATAEGAAGNQRYWFSWTAYTDKPACGYRLSDSQYQGAQRTLSLLGVRAAASSGGWNVTTAQPAQPIVGLLFDSRASQKLTTGQPLPC